jgi:hypothetical protein
LWSVYHRTLLIEFPIKIANHISLIEPCYSFHYLILITNSILLNISLITMFLFHLCFRLIACIVMPTDKNCCMQNLWERSLKREGEMRNAEALVTNKPTCCCPVPCTVPVQFVPTVYGWLTGWWTRHFHHTKATSPTAMPSPNFKVASGNSYRVSNALTW